MGPEDVGLVQRSDSEDGIPLHRVAVVRPFANVLTDVGASVERGFRRAGLPVCALEDVDNYIPSHRFWAFLVDVAHSQGIPDLGFRVGQRYGANCADPHLNELLCRAPTLFQGLLRASDLTNKTISHCRLGLLQPAGSGYTRFYHSPSCDARNPAIEQIGWFGLMTLIGMVRAYAGPHWQPGEIGVMVNQLPGRYIREQFPGTRIRLAQPYSYIALENALLSLPPLNSKGPERRSSTLRGEALPREFVASLSRSLRPYILDDDLSIKFAAGLCGMSKRSLQRRLAAKGTHYCEVLDRVRFDAAKRLLEDPARRVADVAYVLGYSDPSHFARAFRRIAGITPREYRQTLSH